MNKSFTLIEILIVIAVVGALSTFVLVGTSSITNKASNVKSITFSDSLRNSLLTNLYSEWKFDEGSGSNSYDSWGDKNLVLGATTGSEDSDPTWMSQEECISGTCLDFSKTIGEYAYGTSNLQLDLTNGLTIEAFFKPRTTTQNGSAIFMAGQESPNYIEFALCFWSTGGFGFSLYDYDFGTYDYNSYNTSNLNLIGSWHHAVYTVNFSDRNIVGYLDSKILNPTYYSTLGEISEFDYPFTIGSYIEKNANFFDGKIDELKIYESVLSSYKIKENYFLGLNNLYKNKELSQKEYNQKIVKLKTDIASVD
ncbi:MAG TPA: prepilin-type N-terminal cleavage/methylation domain-containing protein [Candidatus Pacearchaeota archaeon]|nr:prepilin-type N-terminal cleavage/methylation domain-containing protein [Candidatus Pacearchaeota archaeon]